MKRLISLFAAATVVCFIIGFAGVISLINISAFTIVFLLLGGIFCAAAMAIIKEKIGYR